MQPNTLRRLGVSLDRRWLLLSLGAALLTGCGSTGPYVWYTQLPAAEWSSPANDYVIGVGDVLSIKVYMQDNLNGTAKVRRDGRITLPLVGEVTAVGRKPVALAREIEEQLKRFIQQPRVTLSIEQSQPITVTLLGEVARTGALTLEPPVTLVEALAQAGGLTEFADRDKIFVLRRVPTYQRIRFTWDALLENKSQAASFTLRTRDIIVVE